MITSELSRFTDNVTKDGDVIKYTINVRKLYEPGDIKTLVRDYEDLQVGPGTTQELMCSALTLMSLLQLL